MKKDHWCKEYQILQQTYTRAYMVDLWPNGQQKTQAGQGGISANLNVRSTNHSNSKSLLDEHKLKCPECITHFNGVKYYHDYKNNLSN